LPRHHLCLGFAPALLLAACGSGNVATTATVTTIDRTCAIIERTRITDMDGKEVPGSSQDVRHYKGDCNEIDDWDKVKKARSRKVDGSADVHFVYLGPDGKQHNGTFTFTGRDEEFYDLKSGDELKIRVAKDDPTEVWRG
jgi:hypothetical protein